MGIVPLSELPTIWIWGNVSHILASFQATKVRSEEKRTPSSLKPGGFAESFKYWVQKYIGLQKKKHSLFIQPIIYSINVQQQPTVSGIC